MYLIQSKTAFNNQNKIEIKKTLGNKCGTH